MIYFQHYINDSIASTYHLTRTEHSLFIRMQEQYLVTEAPLVRDVNTLCNALQARSDEEQAAVAKVLNEFYMETDTGWVNARYEQQIHEYHDKIAKAAAGGNAKAANEKERHAKAEAESTALIKKLMADIALAKAKEAEAVASLETGMAIEEKCAQPASNLPEAANQNQNQNQIQNQIQEQPPTHSTQCIERDTSMAKTGGEEAIALCDVMKAAGIRVNPDHPSLIAMAEQGVTTATLHAACQDAKISKPIGPISVAYVVAILKRWAVEATALNVAGSSAPQPRHAAGQPEKFNPTAYVNRNRIHAS